MTTYKKKGHKKSNSTNSKMKDKNATAEMFKNIEKTASKSEKWIEKNQKTLLYLLIIVVASLLCYSAYNTYIFEPKQKEGANELSFPKENFEKAINMTVGSDSIFNLALEGTDGKYGFIDITKKYKGTDAGNLANYYAGISYLKIKNYEKAIFYLENFSSKDALIGPIAIGTIGDAFADLGQEADALNYYEKAANAQENSITTPMHLFKAGNTALSLGNNKKAEKLFTQIKEKYPKYGTDNNIEMYINKAKYAKKQP